MHSRLRSFPGAAVLVLAVALSLTAAASPRTDRLVTFLADHDSYRVRAQAAQSLGRVGDARAVDALVSALGDDHAAVRAAAALALGRIGSPAALGALDDLARDTSQPESVRIQARRARDMIRDASARA